MSEFKREARYIVVKPDCEDSLRTERLKSYIDEMCFKTPDCVVVEADWPEYEPVWRMIESRVMGLPNELEYAQSELDALREELATVQRGKDNADLALTTQTKNKDRYKQRAFDAEQRLADAERRNAVMADLLRLIKRSHITLLLSDPPQDPWKYHQIDAKISAALTKPEEAKS